MYEKLVNRLRKAAGPAIDFPDTLYDEAADAIENLSDVIQNHNFLESLIKPDWISVTERLPGNESVLIYSKAGGVAEGKYNPDTEEWTQYRWSAKMKKDVTHWMPLPKPPKEEEQ